MAGPFDNERLDVDCPECKRKFTIVLRDLKRPGAKVKCPKCGVDIKVDSSQLRRELDKAERQVKDFEKKLGNIKF